MDVKAMTAEIVAIAGSQVAAAEMTQLNQATISRLMSGASGARPSADTTDKLKAALRRLRRRKAKNG